MKLNGISIERYTLVLPVDADESILVAKDELLTYVEKACGYALNVATDAHTFDCEILLGDCNRELSAYQKLEKVIYDDGFIIQTEGNRLLICGKTAAGTLYGVYDFLEKFLGVEWYTPSVETVLPTADNIVADVVYDFPCRIRIAHGYNMWDQPFRARKRLSFTVGETNNKPAYGNLRGIEFAFSWGLFGHTHEVFVPYKKYFREHPEYFSFADGHYGEDGRYQLCLTNSDVYEIILKRTMDYLEEHPTCKIVSISQNDSFDYFTNNYCKCKNCMELAEREGAYSAVNLQLVNRIADEVAKKYPEVMIHTFCYKYTQTPPKMMKARDNVIVQLCISLDYGVSLVDELGADVKEYVDSWRDKAKNLYIWTYPCLHWAYGAPIGNFKRIYENTKYLLDMGVYGIFQQENHDYFPCNFSDLRFYLLAKMFVEPTMTYETYVGYIQKFCNAVYGKAGEYIFEYIRLLDALFEGYKTYDNKVYDNKEFIEKSKKLWGKALSAETGECAERIEKLSTQFDFAQACYLYSHKEKGEIPQEEYVAVNKRYWSALKDAGIKLYKENCKLLNLDIIDYTRSPTSCGVRRKVVNISKGKEMQIADANSNPNVTDFDFDFAVEKNGNVFIVDINVQDKAPFTTNNENMNDWEQDSVEFFVSETCSKLEKISEGDYKVRVNADGKFTAFGSEHKVQFCDCRTTCDGYNIKIGFLLPDACKKIGFEIMAHNMQDGKYINTRYWNACPQLLVPTNPSVYGIIEF